MRSRGLRVGGVFAALLLVPAAASARDKSAAAGDGDGNQFVNFTDDLLDAELATPFGDPLFTGHLRPPRTLLIRPRTNFVPELYGSIEQI